MPSPILVFPGGVEVVIVNGLVVVIDFHRKRSDGALVEAAWIRCGGDITKRHFAFIKKDEIDADVADGLGKVVDYDSRKLRRSVAGYRSFPALHNNLAGKFLKCLDCGKLFEIPHRLRQNSGQSYTKAFFCATNRKYAKYTTRIKPTINLTGLFSDI